MKTVGLIGCGAIGALIAEAVERRLVLCDELILYDYDLEKATLLKSALHFPTTVFLNLDEMLKLQPTVIVEAASQQAAREYVPRIVKNGIDLIVMSTGALLQLPPQGGRVHVPSGAIGGVDALSGGGLAGVEGGVLSLRREVRA